MYEKQAVSYKKYHKTISALFLSAVILGFVIPAQNTLADNLSNTPTVADSSRPAQTVFRFVGLTAQAQHNLPAPIVQRAQPNHAISVPDLALPAGLQIDHVLAPDGQSYQSLAAALKAWPNYQLQVNSFSIYVSVASQFAPEAADLPIQATVTFSYQYASQTDNPQPLPASVVRQGELNSPLPDVTAELAQLPTGLELTGVLAPDGKLYQTLKAALAANPTYQRISEHFTLIVAQSPSIPIITIEPDGSTKIVKVPSLANLLVPARKSAADGKAYNAIVTVQYQNSKGQVGTISSGSDTELSQFIQNSRISIGQRGTIQKVWIHYVKAANSVIPPNHDVTPNNNSASQSETTDKSQPADHKKTQPASRTSQQSSSASGSQTSHNSQNSKNSANPNLATPAGPDVAEADSRTKATQKSSSDQAASKSNQSKSVTQKSAAKNDKLNPVALGPSAINKTSNLAHAIRVQASGLIGAVAGTGIALLIFGQMDKIRRFLRKFSHSKK